MAFSPHVCVAAATGMVSYAVGFNHPLRGDAWLATEVIANGAMLFYRHLYFALSWTASFQYALTMTTCHLFFLIATAVLYRLSPWHPLSHFPGPILNSITSLKLVAMVASGKRFTVIAEMHRRYGTIVRTGPNTLSINSHDAIAPIYSTAAAWNKTRAYSLGLLPGAGLFFIQDRDTHNIRRRHYWASAFTADAINSYAPMVEKWTNTLLSVVADCSRGGQAPVKISHLLQLWAHDVTGELTFGDSYRLNLLRDGDNKGQVYAALLETIMFEALGEAPGLFEVLWYFPTAKIFRIMDSMAEMMLRRRREHGSQQKDLLSYFLNEDKKRIPDLHDSDLRQETVLAIQAGTNGISTAITFALFYLASNDKIRHRLKAELQEAFPGTSGEDTLDARQLAELPYLNAVTEESLRLGAPLGSFPRITPKGGAIIAGAHIPEGTIVGVPAWAQMISEDNFYPNPQTFIPERWLPGGLGPDSRCNKAAMMTFSHGPFGCLGKPLAYQEMRIVLAKMLLRFDIALPPDFDSAAFLKGVRNMRVTSFTVPFHLTVT